jgi:hypothetical protein
MTPLLLAELKFSSCAGIARRKTGVNALMTRASIIFAKKMDGRIKSGHDETRGVPA